MIGSFSHNTEADFAASELARMFVRIPSLCYAEGELPAGLSASASYEPPSSPWPKPDGLVALRPTGSAPERAIAIEYKREQEGIHGLLTAIGQAQAYIHKGYSGAALVIPKAYASLAAPGDYVNAVLNRAEGTRSIGIFQYDPPDTQSATPFADRLHCIRPIAVGSQASSIVTAATRPKTQWVHMREGSTTRDAFFRFLQTAKRLSAETADRAPIIPAPLRAAIARIAPDKSAEEYLSNTADSTKFLSRVWQTFWFEWVATENVLTPWKREEGRYVAPGAFTRLRKDDETGDSQIFEGRADGLKELIVEELNAGTITEAEGWEQLATGIHRPDRQNKQGVRDRAHSYREDLDSSLAQLKWIDEAGRPTDYAFHYMGFANVTEGRTLLQR